jgi:hypothetical protein
MLSHFVMNALGIPMVGEIHVLTPTTGAARTFWRDKIYESNLHTTLPAAYSALVEGRNDVIVALPGTYTQTDKVTWAKDNTHLIGAGGLNQRIPATAGMDGNVYFPCVTAMTEEFLITGNHCQFQNFSTYLSTATGIADVRVQGRNVHLKNLFMKGGQHATQFASAILGYSLYVDAGTAGYAHALRVEDCMIGDPRNSSSGDGATPRTAGGQIYLKGTTNAGSCVEFKRCFIGGWSHTAGCYAVFHDSGLDRHILWEDCTFYNFYTNLASTLTNVFHDTCGTTHIHLLTGRTSQYGWAYWSDNDAYIFGGMPVCDVAGGKMVTLTT